MRRLALTSLVFVLISVQISSMPWNHEGGVRRSEMYLKYLAPVAHIEHRRGDPAGPGRGRFPNHMIDRPRRRRRRQRRRRHRRLRHRGGFASLFNPGTYG